MKINKIVIYILCIITIVTAIIPVGVSAAETLDLFQFEKIYTDGNICTIEYFAPKNSIYTNVIIIGNRSVSYGSIDKWHLIFYEPGTTFNYNNSTKAWEADKTFVYKTYSSYELAVQILFEGQETEEFTPTTAFAGFTYGEVYLYQETKYASEANQSLEVAYYDWYLELNGTEPTFKENSDGNSGTGTVDKEYQDGVLGWFEKLFDKIAEIPDAITTLINIITLNEEKIILDQVGKLVNNKLKDNEFYTSTLRIRDTLTELFNEDYSSRSGFYELGLTNITLGKTQTTIAKDFGNDIIGDFEQEYHIEGKIDYGLNNVKVLNLDWYFGKDLEDGYYVKGMKPYIDNIVSAFLWIMFGWALYINMPNWISGEMTRISNLTNGTYGNRKEIKINTKTRTDATNAINNTATYNKMHDGYKYN